MGNKPGRRKVVVEEQYTKPQGLYETREINLRQLKKLILQGKLSPCYIGVDETIGQDLEECPICLLCYPSLNRSLCCGKGICTECFLQLRPPPSSRLMLCPFCKTPTFAVEFRGEKTAEEKGLEAEEEQKILAAKIRQQEEEKRADEERQGRMRQDPHFQRTLQQELIRQQLTLGGPSASQDADHREGAADTAAPSAADGAGPALGEGGRSQSAREGPTQAPPLGSSSGAASRSGIFSRVSRRGSAESAITSASSTERSASSRERPVSKQSGITRSISRRGGTGIQPSQLLLPRAMVGQSSSSSSGSGAVAVPLQVVQVSGAQVPGAGGEETTRRVQQLAEQYFDMSVFSGDEDGSRRATPYARLSLTPEHSDLHQHWLTRPRGPSSGGYGRAGTGASSSAGVTPSHVNATSSADVSGALSLASPPPPQYPPTRFNLIVPRNQPGLDSVTPSSLALSPSSAAAAGQVVGGPVGVYHHHQHVHQHIHEHLFTGGGNGVARGTSEAAAAAAAAAEAAVGGGRVPAFQQSPAGDEEQGMDLDDILLMQAIWMSLQDQPGQEAGANSAGLSSGVRGRDLEDESAGDMGAQARGVREEGAELALSGGMDRAGSGQGGVESELDVPDDFDEQMRLALAISLAEANEASQQTST